MEKKVGIFGGSFWSRSFKRFEKLRRSKSLHLNRIRWIVIMPVFFTWFVSCIVSKFCPYSLDQEEISFLQISSSCSLQICAPLDYYVLSSPFFCRQWDLLYRIVAKFFWSYHIDKLCFCHCVMREKNKRRIVELCCLMLVFLLIVWSVLPQSIFCP